MLILSILPILASGAVAVWILRTVYGALFSSLSRVPGPFTARFTDLWYANRIYRGHFELDNIALHDKYGPVVRYGPNRCSVSSPLAAKVIYGHGSEFPKSSWYETFSVPDKSMWNLFGDREVKRHAANRRQYQNTYSLSALINYEAYVNDCSDIFCQRLSELSSNQGPQGGAINMGHWLQCYAFDVIGMITYSKRIGFLDFGQDINNVMGELGDHLLYAAIIGIYPFLHPVLYPIRNWLAGAGGKGREYVINFTKSIMADHRAQPKVSQSEEKLPVDDGEQASQPATEDFLSKFMQKHTANPEVFTKYHALAGCTSNMVAGSDTTSITLSAILYYILRDPVVLGQLREEINEATRQGKLSEHVTFQQSQDMPYLQAVIKETLRMHPATGLPLERVVPAGGTTIEGYFLPAGTHVGINTWVEHRNKSIFGDDANEFNPRRWLDTEKDKLSEMNRHWVPFGLGSRTCIGRHISMLEISKLIPRLIRDFDFELCNAGPWKTKSVWFVKPEEFNVFTKPRIRASVR